MKFILVPIIIISLAFSVSAEDQIYPLSLAVSCNYEVSQTNIDLGESFTISRSIVNGENYLISGLYLSDHLPPEFVIQSRQVKINGNNVTYTETGPALNSTVAGYNAFRWILDDPIYGTPQNVLAAGDSLSVVLTVVCNTSGNYTLDFHTVTGYGNQNGFFSLNSSPISMTVSLVTSVDEDLPLPSRTFIANAYPNPFNGPVTIQFENAQGGEIDLEVYNIAGQRVYQATSSVSSGTGFVRWDALASGSGLYFYRIHNGLQRAAGKIVLIK